MIDHPVFGEMHALFKFHERARSHPIEDIVRDMEVQNVVKGVITSRDAETTYGIASGNKGVIPFLEQYPDRFIGMAGLDPHKGMDAIDELRLMVETHGFPWRGHRPVPRQDSGQPRKILSDLCQVL